MKYSCVEVVRVFEYLNASDLCGQSCYEQGCMHDNNSFVCSTQIFTYSQKLSSEVVKVQGGKSSATIGMKEAVESV